MAQGQYSSTTLISLHEEAAPGREWETQDRVKEVSKSFGVLHLREMGKGCLVFSVSKRFEPMLLKIMRDLNWSRNHWKKTKEMRKERADEVQSTNFAVQSTNFCGPHGRNVLKMSMNFEVLYYVCCAREF